MNSKTPFDPSDFDPLVAARCIVRDPRRFNQQKLDGYRLDDIQQAAVIAELKTMAELATQALLPGDPDREKILVAYAAATDKLPSIPAGK